MYIYWETQTIWETNILKDLQDFGIIFLDESQTEDRVDSKSQTTRVRETYKHYFEGIVMCDGYGPGKGWVREWEKISILEENKLWNLTQGIE